MISRKIMVGVSVLLSGGLDAYFDQDYILDITKRIIQ